MSALAIIDIVLGGLIVAAIIVAFFVNLPELRRYLRMKRM